MNMKFATILGTLLLVANAASRDLSLKEALRLADEHSQRLKKSQADLLPNILAIAAYGLGIFSLATSRFKKRAA